MNTKTKEITTAEPLPVATPNPLMILDRAIEKGIDADQLEKLMVLQERWEANQARKAFDSAMADFQADCPIIPKTKQADRYTYAPLDTVLTTIRPHLKSAGLSVRFSTKTDGPVITAICTVSHRDGHNEVSYFAAPVDDKMRVNDTQKMGSANTYAKRYALMNALNLAAGNEDDDGFSAGPVPLDKEQIKGQKKERKSRKSQDPATKEQLAEIGDYIESLRDKPASAREVTQLEYWIEHKDSMSKLDAAEILRRLKA